MIRTEEASPPRLVLLLGAGTSVAAGVPTTVEFVDKFLAVAGSDSKLKALIEEMRKRDRHADVEQLLRVLRSLSSREDDPELLFFQRRHGLPGSAAITKWRKDLELFIKKQCFVPAEKVGYFEPLRRLLANYSRPLDIFTVNYDTSVEVFCLRRGIRFNNGFRGVWQPDVFKDAETDIRLYKIHGSVTWWSTDEGIIVEIPVRLDRPETQLYYGARARSLIIYPYGPGKSSPQPALDLLPFLRETLQDAAVLVVAGYSFRDEEIRDRVLDAMRLNKDLTLVMIGPSAYRVYEKRLKWAARGVPSFASKRTAILPFTFEAVMPHLQDTHLRSLANGTERHRLLMDHEVKYGSLGEPQDWAYACESFAQGGSLELALDLMRRSDTAKWPFDPHLRAAFTAAAIATWSGAKGLREDFEAEASRVLQRLSDSVRVRGSQERLSVEFNLAPPERGEAPRKAWDILRWLVDLRKSLRALENLTRKGNAGKKTRLDPLMTRLASLIGYFTNNWDDSKPLPVGLHLQRWSKAVGTKLFEGKSQDFTQQLEKDEGLRSSAVEAEGAAIRKAVWGRRKASQRPPTNDREDKSGPTQRSKRARRRR